MTPNDGRWIWFLLGRVAVHVLSGALACALVGALLIAASGTVTGWICDIGQNSKGSAEVGALFGVWFGGISGAFVGLFVFAILGFSSAPRGSFWPAKSFFLPIFVGMALATLGVMSSYFAGCFLLSRGQGSFSGVVNNSVLFILFAAPAVMLCGQIAGAVVAFRLPKLAPSA